MNPYADDIAGAIEAIEEDGEAVTWFKPAAHDPAAKPWRDVRDGAPPEFPTFMAFFSPIDLARGRGLSAEFANGTDVGQFSEIGLLAGGQDFEPEITDWIVRTSGKAEIVAIDKIAPNGVAIMYFVGVK